MTSTGDVAAQIRRACDTAAKARQALEQAEDLAQEAHELLAGTLGGVVFPALSADVERMLADFVSVTDGCKGYWWPMLNEAITAAQAIADRVAKAADAPATGGGPTPTRRPASPRQATTRPAEVDDPPAVPPERVERLRRALPPPVVPGTGQRTHGVWIGPDGQALPIKSERDHRSVMINDQLVAKGWPDGTPRSGDVEMKLAADMAANGIRHATVVINHVPCKGKLNCDTLVPILLPEGSTLTVHGINENGTRVRIRYTGGAQPWWT